VPAQKYLIDTNVLLRIFRVHDPQHQLTRASLDELGSRGTRSCFSLQNIAELWNVCTRPEARNGYGLTIADTSKCVEYIENTMTFLPDNRQVFSIWRKLVVDYGVRGVQVHDARLVAIMLAYGLTKILTMNQQDFLRYPSIKAVHPSQVQPSSR
jgi:predicted nucleic acid-binding protein